MVAPREIRVDLIVLDEPTASIAHPSGVMPGGRPAPQPAPCLEDFGACLWGPPAQTSNAKRAQSTGGGEGPRKGPTRSGSFGGQPGNAAEVAVPAPRPVLFAYVAQPGGRLWCVGLADGEVESMHRPPVEVDSANAAPVGVGAGWRGAAAGVCVELGQLRTVDLGSSWVREERFVFVFLGSF